MTTAASASRRAWVNLASVIGTITVNALANIVPFNGQNTGQVSDRFAVYFVPAGYVFAIWGVIYVAWLAFCAFQLLPSQRHNPRFAALGYWFAASGVLNSLWLVCWHYNQFVFSLVVMLALLGTLIMSYRRLGVGRTASGAVERWCVDAVFGLYLGWISVATIANAADVLWLLGWGGWGIAPQVWTAVMLAVATALGAAMVWRRYDAIFPLVLVWAFVGIADRQSGRFALPEPALVVNAAWLAAAISLLLAITAVGLRVRRARRRVR
jgi:benzodiazapine receptor